MIPGLVSTIIPVYNRAAQLREAVESVLMQDWRQIEVLIVDDGSTDETRSTAQALAEAHPGVVRVLVQENAGPGAARERGRCAAEGEFIQYLDSDDILLPGKFRSQVEALRMDPTCDVAYGMTRFRKADGSLVPGPWKGSGTARASMFPSFLNERWWDTPNPLYRRSICDRAGSWTSLRLHEDWEYDCRIASQGVRLAWREQYVCEVRDHAGERLCRGAAEDPSRLRDRARAHELIFAHARRAGIGSDSPELQEFARALFLLARQCGAAGLTEEPARLFGLAQEACGVSRARGLDYRCYRAVAHVVGWTAAGRMSHWLDKVRPR